jgi:transposase
VRVLRPAPKPDPVVRFETEPGCQMQADWATVGRGEEQLKVLIGTLGWRRATHKGQHRHDENGPSKVRQERSNSFRGKHGRSLGRPHPESFSSLQV